MAAAQRCVVVGAGVVGTAIAWALARRGAEVDVLDAAAPGAGASGATLGWLRARSTDPVWHRFVAAGLHDLRELAGTVPGLRSCCRFPGGIDLARGERAREALAGTAERLAALGYPARPLTAARARELEPRLRVPGDALAVHFADEGYVHGAPLCGAFLDLARGHGARAHWGVRVESVVPARTGVTVRAAGLELVADVVVLAAGRWTRVLAARSGLAVPGLDAPDGAPRGGALLATTEPLAWPVRHPVGAGELTLRPAGGGRLLLHAADQDPRGAAPDGAPGAGRELARRLAELLPDTGTPAIESVRVGVEAVPAGAPGTAGFLDGGRVYAAVPRSGVAVAARLGPLVAHEVAGTPMPELDALRRTGAPATAARAHHPSPTT